MYNLIYHPHTIITNFIIHLDIGLFIVFSLAFIFLQILISLGIASFQVRYKDTDKNTIELFNLLFEKVEINCDILINKITLLWKFCLSSLTIIFIYYLESIILGYIDIPILSRIGQLILLLLLLLIILMNLTLLSKALSVPFIESYSQIKEAVRGIVFREFKSRGNLPERELEKEIKELLEKRI